MVLRCASRPAPFAACSVVETRKYASTRSPAFPEIQGYPGTVCGCTNVNVLCGGSCALCGNANPCTAGTDCTSGTCTPYFTNPGTYCVPAHCIDSIQDNNETHVDCGGNSAGSGCNGCAAGASCGNSADCASFHCSGGVCQ